MVPPLNNTAPPTDPTDPAQLETIHKLLSNVATHPSDGKYRKINKANTNFIRRLGRFREGLAALCAAGFVEESDEFLVLPPANDGQLQDAMNAVDDALHRTREEAARGVGEAERMELERRQAVRESLDQRKNEDARRKERAVLQMERGVGGGAGAGGGAKKLAGAACKGMVGIKNQGSTCFMNCYLQVLYHLVAVRQAVLGCKQSQSRMVAALQDVFFEMQEGDAAAETYDLTGTFGWDAQQGRRDQHDAHEFCTLLTQSLHERIPGGVFERVFKGQTETLVACRSVDCRSRAAEDTWGLSIDVAGCDSVAVALGRYFGTQVMQAPQFASRCIG